MNIGFVGLGLMGGPMAHNLLKGGHTVRGFDPAPTALDLLAERGGTPCSSPCAAAEDADVVITMLPNDRIVREAVMGDKGSAAGMAQGALHVDMSTSHPLESDRLREELAGRGIGMVDAPVGRTAAHAVTGTLLVLAGGTPAQLARLEPIFSLLGEKTIDCGGPGRGIRMKIVNNFMSIALNALSVEALALCDALALPRETAIDMMQGTPAGKGHFTTTYPKKIFAGDTSPDFALRLAHKDLGLVMDLAGRLAIPLPVGAAAREVYSAAMARGFGDRDWTALLEASGVTSSTRQ